MDREYLIWVSDMDKNTNITYTNIEDIYIDTSIHDALSRNINLSTIYTNFEHLDTTEYNTFFHPSICHVCKLRGNNELIACERCSMIYYCSKEHKLAHQPNHIEICKRIETFLEERPEMRLRRYNSLNKWFMSKKNFLHLIQASLSRELRSYEVQMLMCPKSCFVCHRQTDLRLHCPFCLSTFFCKKHLKYFNDYRHTIRCKHLILLLNMNLMFMRMPRVLQYNFNLFGFPDRKKYDYNMASFAEHYIIALFANGPDEMNLVEIVTYLNSCDDISGPLTFFDGMQKSNLLYLLDGDVCIHIVGANFMDEKSAQVWEILLHRFRLLKNLTIVMIGPEVYVQSEKLDICGKCKYFKQSFSYECHPVLYHNYLTSTSYKPPTVIVGFQAELNDEKTWVKSILAFRIQNCPLILTAKSPNKARENITQINKILITDVKPFLNIENNYKSPMPYTDFETDFVFYRNTILTVYKNLRGSE